MRTLSLAKFLLIVSQFLLATVALGQQPRLWQWQQSSCLTCPISIEILNPEVNTEKVEEFARALSEYKFEILAIYGSDPQEYNLLAHMALGILGRESEFFTSWRYLVKENAQWAVSLLKIIRIYLDGGDNYNFNNSRGPTQVKVIPAKIAKHYKITPDDLNHPENAAKATMGMLIENLRELKQRALNNSWEFVSKDTYVDYLPYLYFGAVSRLKNRTATPNTNIYVRDMKRYMTFFALYEWPPLRGSQP